MSDKSIFGGGGGAGGLGRGHDKQLPRGVHVAGRERVRFPTLSYPTFSTPIVLPMIRFDSIRAREKQSERRGDFDRRASARRVGAMDGSIDRKERSEEGG